MIDPTAFLAPGVIVLGDVVIGRDASLWYGCVARGDTERITVGDETNIQDLCLLHADPGLPCVIGPCHGRPRVSSTGRSSKLIASAALSRRAA